MADTKAKRMNRAQEKAKSYIEEHNIEKIISEMLNSLVHARDPHPVIFMVTINYNDCIHMAGNSMK